MARIGPVIACWTVAIASATLHAQYKGALGDEFQVNTYTTGQQYFPALARTGLGQMMVVWKSDQQDGSYGSIFGQRYDSLGSALGAELQVNLSTQGEQTTPAIVADPLGGFLVIWAGAAGITLDVFGHRYDSSGATIGAEIQMGAEGAQQPAVAMDSAGSFVVAWHSYEGYYSYNEIFARRFDSGGDPVGEAFHVNTYTELDQTEAAVAKSDDGAFVVLWVSRTDVLGQRFDSGGSPLAGEFQVNTHTLGTQRGPAIGMDSTGSFVVVWEDQSGLDGNSIGIFGQRYDSGGTSVGGQFQINARTTRAQYSPSLSVGANGDFVVTWTSYRQDSSDSGGVFGRRFSSSGTPLDAEFLVNSYTVGNQGGSAVAMDDDGDFVVVWQGAKSVPAPATGPAPDGGRSTGRLEIDFTSDVFGRSFGDVTPSPTATPTMTFTPSPTFPPITSTPTATGFVTATPDLPTETPTATDFVTATPDLPTETPSSTATATPTATPSATATMSPSPTPSATATSFPGLAALDLDANGRVEPLTDGLLLIRYLFGFRGEVFIANAVDLLGCERCEAAAIEDYLASILGQLDVDGDGSVSPLTDGLLILRYLFGFRGDVLLLGAYDTIDCTRCDAAAIEAYIESLL